MYTSLGSRGTGRMNRYCEDLLDWLTDTFGLAQKWPPHTGKADTTWAASVGPTLC